MISKPRYLWLWITLTGAWISYGSLLLAQILRLQAADPQSDTGLSFGYHFLVRFCGPALLVITLMFVGVVFVANRKTAK